MKDIETISDGRVRMTTGTLYGALRRLLDEGWIERFATEDTSREKQAYRLTALGRKRLVGEVQRMQQVTHAAMARLSGAEAWTMCTRIYLLFLQLYPAAHRAQFGSEMAEVFASAAQERHDAGKLAYLWFVVRELASLLAGAWPERLAQGHQRLAPVAQTSTASIESVQLISIELAAAQKRVQTNINRMVAAIANHQFEQARYYAHQEQREREYLNTLEKKQASESS
jgi:DNA-binding MarR family transcriptional regulator